MISMRDYWMGRDTHYPQYFNPTLRATGERTVALVNQLLERAAADGVVPCGSDNGFGYVRSGWRPPIVNAATPNAAKNSLHMTAQALDLNDDFGDVDDWLMSPAGQQALADVGLWMEPPAATKR